MMTPWCTEPSCESTAALHGAWSAPDSRWAVGDNGTVLRSARGTHAWYALPPPSSAALWSVWASADDDAWVGGEDVLAHWDGHSWTVMSVPRDAAQCGKDPITVHALSGTGPNDVWAAAANLRNRASFALHFRGAGWEKVDGVTLAQCNGEIVHTVVAVAPDDVWFGVGYGAGFVEHWNGASVEQITTGSHVGEIVSLAVDGKVLWGVSQNGEVVHYDGMIWSYQSASTLRTNASGQMTAVWARGGKAYAVTSTGEILESDGSSWQRIFGPTGSRLDAVSSDETAWAVGAAGIAFASK